MTENLLYSCRILTATVLMKVFFTVSESPLLSYIFFTLVLLFFRKDIDLLGEMKKPLSLKKAVLFIPLFLVFSFILSALFPVSTPLPEKTFMNAIFIAVLGPLYEEIFFRKLLTKGLGRGLAPIVSSVIFGLFHGVDGFLPAFFAGLLLYLIYKLSGSIKLPFISHLLNNVLALIFN